MKLKSLLSVNTHTHTHAHIYICEWIKQTFKVLPTACRANKYETGHIHTDKHNWSRLDCEMHGQNTALSLTHTHTHTHTVCFSKDRLYDIENTHTHTHTHTHTRTQLRESFLWLRTYLMTQMSCNTDTGHMHAHTHTHTHTCVSHFSQFKSGHTHTHTSRWWVMQSKSVSQETGCVLSQHIGPCITVKLIRWAVCFHYILMCFNYTAECSGWKENF